MTNSEPLTLDNVQGAMLRFFTRWVNEDGEEVRASLPEDGALFQHLARCIEGVQSWVVCPECGYDARHKDYTNKESPCPE